MKARVKYHVIYRHRTEYPVVAMYKFFAVSRSGYYSFVHRLGRPEKDAALAEVIAHQQKRSLRTYGYRRMWLWLKRQNIFHNPKTVLRVMRSMICCQKSAAAGNGSRWGSNSIATKDFSIPLKHTST